MAADGAREQQTPPKLNAAKQFAQALAKELYLGRSRNEFGRAILVAPPSFMGMLNANLDGPTGQMVTDRLEKDYTKTAEPALRGQPRKLHPRLTSPRAPRAPAA